MQEIQEVLSAILKSLLGLTFILVGIIFAVFKISYIAIPLGVIGFLVCWFAYLNLKILQENRNDGCNDDDLND